MAYCSKCGNEVAEGSSFCSNCKEEMGNIGNNLQNPSVSAKITDKDFATFIGKNASLYITKFKKFNTGGLDKFAPTWHWPACFVTVYWLLYRRLYLWALLIFCLSLITNLLIHYYIFLSPVWGWIICIIYSIIWFITCGITANYLYYRHAKKKFLN
jgi:hypothetical protein